MRMRAGVLAPMVGHALTISPSVSPVSASIRAVPAGNGRGRLTQNVRTLSGCQPQGEITQYSNDDTARYSCELFGCGLVARCQSSEI
jgi:hypothetical protein